jgi:hypothetical protein
LDEDSSTRDRQEAFRQKLAEARARRSAHSFVTTVYNIKDDPVLGRSTDLTDEALKPGPLSFQLLVEGPAALERQEAERLQEEERPTPPPPTP